ncbi:MULTISPECIES: LemA family protein [unclassified Clostridium]|uniref:LemA family protein n=1 Tax=unclassified Clostridium TaxID=2614128 RepID=UPI0025B897EA|nr:MULTISPECIES: LemA family protein [unclassified Clostridium]
MKNIKTTVIILVGVVLIGILSVFVVNGVQNKAIGLEEQIKTADSDIKVQEKRRVDLVYNLVDTVKQYDKHEYNTLKDIVDARSSDKKDINNIITMLNATAEAYPELKSNTNYKQLMNELSITENMIAEYRSNYNKQIKEYNRYIKKFPNKQFLNILGYEVVKFNYLDYNAPVDAPQNLFGE